LNKKNEQYKTETLKLTQTGIHTHKTDKKLKPQIDTGNDNLAISMGHLIDEHCEGVLTLVLQQVWIFFIYLFYFFKIQTSWQVLLRDSNC